MNLLPQFPEFSVEWHGSFFESSTISGFFQWKLPKSPRFKISGSFAWIENEGAQKLESVRGFIRTHDNLLEIWDLELAKKCMQHAGQHLTERIKLLSKNGSFSKKIALLNLHHSLWYVPSSSVPYYMIFPRIFFIQPTLSELQ